MDTLIEHDVPNGGTSSALTAIVAIIAIVFVAGIALYVMRIYPFNVQPVEATTDPPAINVNVTGSLPGDTPSGQ
ncbi:MAG: hypothetical protein PHZ00_06915 [Candidatus Peribacteraceae bacterium]|nr:hypothetical protein [Candidatus Peribacteraceae bacterium]